MPNLEDVRDVLCFALRILSLPEQVCDVYSFYGVLLKLTFSIPILQAWEHSGKVWA